MKSSLQKTEIWANPQSEEKSIIMETEILVIQGAFEG